MNKKRLLTREERAYVIQKISGLNAYYDDFGKLNKENEEELICSIVGKIQAP